MPSAFGQVDSETHSGRHAHRQAPIQSELLARISVQAPIPHLFLLDRAERSDEAVSRLVERGGGRSHVLTGREREDYLLVRLGGRSGAGT